MLCDIRAGPHPDAEEDRITNLHTGGTRIARLLELHKRCAGVMSQPPSTAYIHSSSVYTYTDIAHTSRPEMTRPNPSLLFTRGSSFPSPQGGVVGKSQRGYRACGEPASQPDELPQGLLHVPARWTGNLFGPNE